MAIYTKTVSVFTKYRQMQKEKTMATNDRKDCTFAQIDPFVRYVQRFRVAENAYPVFFRPYDCRLFFVCEGSGRVFFENTSCPLNRGNLILWKAGVGYRMTSNDHDPLILLGCNFDFTKASSHVSHPVPPSHEDEFLPLQMLDDVRFADNYRFNDVIYLHNVFPAENVLLEMHAEYNAQKMFCNQRLSSLLQSILCLAYREVSLSSDGSPHPIAVSRIEEVIRYIQGHYAEELTNKSIGAYFNYHPNYLSRQIISYTGKSLRQYLISYRIARAIDIITTTDTPIWEVAAMVGFSNSSHFCKIFRQKTGLAPSAMRSPEGMTYATIDWSGSHKLGLPGVSADSILQVLDD